MVNDYLFDLECECKLEQADSVGFVLSTKTALHLAEIFRLSENERMEKGDVKFQIAFSCSLIFCTQQYY
jgi:hypothetical protein